MKNAIILMTALIPTTGHRDLIKFAESLPDVKVHVFINGRSFEPYQSLQRWMDIHEEFKNSFNVVISHTVEDNAPQNPEDMPDGFWEWWRDSINKKFPNVSEWDYVIASEDYGAQVAESLDATFIPYDIDRSINSARGTDVRSDMWGNWDKLLKRTKQNFQQKAVVFGQESVGKTTVSKRVAEILQSEWLPEWARPYLETVGSDLTSDKMNTIVMGQYSIMNNAFENPSTPAIVLDTDLYSTIGYYNISIFEKHPKIKELASRTRGSAYYILPDDIPFVEDELRYGGSVRESSTDFWIELCREYKLDYVIVPSGSVEDKATFIANNILERFEKSVFSIKNFQRD